MYRSQGVVAGLLTYGAVGVLALAGLQAQGKGSGGRDPRLRQALLAGSFLLASSSSWLMCVTPHLHTAASPLGMHHSASFYIYC